jgi:hypothetical protein
MVAVEQAGQVGLLWRSADTWPNHNAQPLSFCLELVLPVSVAQLLVRRIRLLEKATRRH